MSKRTPKRSRARQMLTMVPAAVPVGCGFKSWPGERTSVTGRDPCAQAEADAERLSTHQPRREGCREPRRGFSHPLPRARALRPFPGRSHVEIPAPRISRGCLALGAAGSTARTPWSPGNQARHASLHTTLVREQIRGAPRLAGQNCRVGTLQVTPIEEGTWTSVLEERFPHRSSRHSCLPHSARCAWLSHSTRHRPS